MKHLEIEFEFDLSTDTVEAIVEEMTQLEDLTGSVSPSNVEVNGNGTSTDIPSLTPATAAITSALSRNELVFVLTPLVAAAQRHYQKQQHSLHGDASSSSSSSSSNGDDNNSSSNNGMNNHSDSNAPESSLAHVTLKDVMLITKQSAVSTNATLPESTVNETTNSACYDDTNEANQTLRYWNPNPAYRSLQQKMATFMMTAHGEPYNNINIDATRISVNDSDVVDIKSASPYHYNYASEYRHVADMDNGTWQQHPQYLDHSILIDGINISDGMFFESDEYKALLAENEVLTSRLDKEHFQKLSTLSTQEAKTNESYQKDHLDLQNRQTDLYRQMDDMQNKCKERMQDFSIRKNRVLEEHLNALNTGVQSSAIDIVDSAEAAGARHTSVSSDGGAGFDVRGVVDDDDDDDDDDDFVCGGGGGFIELSLSYAVDTCPAIKEVTVPPIENPNTPSNGPRSLQTSSK